MKRLGYTRYVAQGGDVGALVTDLMGRQAVEGLVGYPHQPAHGVARSRRSPAQGIRAGTRRGRGGRDLQAGRLRLLPRDGTRPQTIRYALLDSPVALAAWLLDHDTDSYYKISGAFVDGKPVGNLTRDNILDNITLYWLTGTAPRRPGRTGRTHERWPQRWRAARLLRRSRSRSGFTTFPGEIWATPRSWVEAVYPGLAYFNEVDRGGHFAAWEEPQLFSAEVRAAFSALR